MWMVANIAYDEVELKKNVKEKGGKVSFKKGDTKADVARKLQEHYFNYATKVLQKRRGICEGYASLFYELCKASEIECDVVWGLASNYLKKIERYKKSKSMTTNHAWNKVKLNGQWLFIDVTWASKSTYDGKRHESDYYNPYYYLTTEDKPFITHVENKKKSKQRNEWAGNY